MTSNHKDYSQTDNLPLKLACADFSFPLLSHDESFDIISMLGFNGIDIGLFPGRSHFQLNNFINDIENSACDLSTKLKDRGLEIADIFFQPSSELDKLAPNHPNKEQRTKWRDLFQRTLEFTAYCGASHVTTLPGIHFKDEEHIDSLKRACDELSWCAEKATEMNIVLAVEPHMWSIAPTTRLVKVLIDMSDNLTLTLDYGHFIAQGEPDQTIEPLIRYASHFHARASCPDFLQTTMANNTINFPQIMKAMQNYEYSGYIGVEYVRMEHDIAPDVDNISETILMRDLFISSWKTNL
jgi:sugar phosphate isomerase/epimerase